MLIAALNAATLLNWTQVAVGLGTVIFVHELGHFLVAKACGVKCEKFYLGFDIGGWKLFSFKWGETEYGIGVLPLGGYVKMLGQEDNPSKAYEEMQRAKTHEAPPPPVESWAADRTEESENEVYDPRSYLAQSVPKRMAIISAGVIMNLIFAFIMATVAYLIGVSYTPSVISGVVPGQPAWAAGLQVGDEILAIDSIQKPRYDLDLIASVALSDLNKGIALKVQRGDQPPFDVVLRPDTKLGLPKVGIASPLSLKLMDKAAAMPGTPAAKTEPPLAGGDVIVSADGQSLENYAQLDRVLSQRRNDPLPVTVRRETPESTAEKVITEEISTTIAPNPMLHYGLVMEMGPIVAVQKDSPAEKQGVQPGDRIIKIDGAEPGDPMTLPDRLYRRAGESVTLTLQKGNDPPRDATFTISEPESYDWPKVDIPNVPRAISGIGIAYSVLNTVAAVEPDSPAAKAGVEPGAEIVEATLTLPENFELPEDFPKIFRTRSVTIAFKDDERNWAFLLGNAQSYPADSTLELKFADKKSASMKAVPATDWFNPNRGLMLEPLHAIREADSFAQAVAFGWRETVDATLQVYRFLVKVGRQIPVSSFGGPGSIVAAASQFASEGFSRFLLFLVMLSANLAVLNFLPIPMLDGGHMVFLILEGIRRKPVSEKVVLAFHYAGFLFIVTLMCFVIFLDVRRFLF